MARNKSILEMVDEMNKPQKSGRDKRRAFSQSQKNKIWDQQNGKCADCKTRLSPITTDYDHIRPWAAKGKTITQNGRALCKNCHAKRTNDTNVKKSDKKKQVRRNDNPFGIKIRPLEWR